MKNLQLTEEHKAKLLEMCKSFFPEQETRLVKPVFSTPDTFFVQMGLKSSISYGVEIHWFEFCTIHLLRRVAEKLAQHNPEREEWLAEDIEAETLEIIREYHRVISHSLIFWGSLNNPIDYLYGLFKQLNNRLKIAKK
jgi:hypothetical protein